MIILGEDGVRSQYVPPKPTVKILKRPQRDSRGSGDGPLSNGDKPKQPIKSLKQVNKYTTRVIKIINIKLKILIFISRENRSMQRQENEFWEKNEVPRRSQLLKLIKYNRKSTIKVLPTFKHPLMLALTMR